MAARPLLCKCGIKNGRTQRKVVGEELNNTLVAGRGGAGLNWVFCSAGNSKLMILSFDLAQDGVISHIYLLTEQKRA